MPYVHDLNDVTVQLTAINEGTYLQYVSSSFAPHEGWHAFDHDGSTYWHNRGIYDYETIIFDTKGATTIKGYKLCAAPAPDHADMPITWQVQGTNDPYGAYTLLDTQTGVPAWGDNEQRAYALSGGPATWRYFVFQFYSGSPKVSKKIGEIEPLSDLDGPWGSVLFQVDVDGLISTKVKNDPANYSSEAEAILELPTPDSDKIPIGYATIKANAMATWTANTDDMTVGSDLRSITFYDYDSLGVVMAAITSSAPATLTSPDPPSAPATLTAPKPTVAPAITAAKPNILV